MNWSDCLIMATEAVSLTSLESRDLSAVGETSFVPAPLAESVAGSVV